MADVTAVREAETTHTVVMTEDSPLAEPAQLIVADFAEAINGKLYLIGAGWARIVVDVAVPIAVGVLVHIPTP